ncbi:YdiK family protein [Bacillus sp. CGMCC 1.60114]|uniref:YdiK family protein n=1 Tax=unclassified Bacillus (in: firmicutes) TaxID=185979 RepID=UPI00362B82CD
MRNSPFVMATLYFLLGCIFTYLAITSVEDTIWNFYTLLLAIMATVDFNLALRLLFSKSKKGNMKK